MPHYECSFLDVFVSLLLGVGVVVKRFKGEINMRARTLVDTTMARGSTLVCTGCCWSPLGQCFTLSSPGRGRATLKNEMLCSVQFFFGHLFPPVRLYFVPTPGALDVG